MYSVGRQVVCSGIFISLDFRDSIVDSVIVLHELVQQRLSSVSPSLTSW